MALRSPSRKMEASDNLDWFPSPSSICKQTTIATSYNIPAEQTWLPDPSILYFSGGAGLYDDGSHFERQKYNLLCLRSQPLKMAPLPCMVNKCSTGCMQILLTCDNRSDQIVLGITGRFGAYRLVDFWPCM